jgi:thermitase
LHKDYLFLCRVFSGDCVIRDGMRRIWMIWLLFAGVQVLAEPRLRIAGERAWLQMAYRSSLVKVLGQFEKLGAEVMLDPSLAGVRVLGDWEDVAVEQLLKELVSPYDYSVEWHRISGPLGSIDQVSRIYVYGEGGLSAAKRLSVERRVLDVYEPDDGSQPYIANELLIGFEAGASVETLRQLLAAMGGTILEVIDPPGLYRIRLDGTLSVEEAQKLAAEAEGVTLSEPNYAFRHPGTEKISTAGGAEGMNLHLQPGETAVAVFDSGLSPEYASLSIIRGTYNAVNPAEPMSDSLGHGTLVAMIAAGLVTPEGAPEPSQSVPVLAVRTFDENGYTSSTILMDAFRYAKASGVKIINMSWGSETDSAFMRSMMEYAASEGLILVAAAGNEPTGIPLYPSAYNMVLAVGGIESDGRDWSRSNYGPFVAAKSFVYATFNGEKHAGTSIASPYVVHEMATGRRKN